MLQNSITDKLRRIKACKGVSVNHLLGRRYLDGIEEEFKNYKKKEAQPMDMSDNIYFRQDPTTKIVLAFHPEHDMFSNYAAVRYVFLTSDGILLPEVESCGEIRGREQTLEECIRILYEGFEPLKV